MFYALKYLNKFWMESHGMQYRLQKRIIPTDSIDPQCHHETFCGLNHYDVESL